MLNRLACTLLAGGRCKCTAHNDHVQSERQRLLVKISVEFVSTLFDEKTWICRIGHWKKTSMKSWWINQSLTQTCLLVALDTDHITCSHYLLVPSRLITTPLLPNCTAHSGPYQPCMTPTSASCGIPLIGNQKTCHTSRRKRAQDTREQRRQRHPRNIARARRRDLRKHTDLCTQRTKIAEALHIHSLASFHRHRVRGSE